MARAVSAFRVQPGALCRLYRAQPGPDEGTAGPVRGGRGRCAPCAAVAAEKPGQVQSPSRRASSGDLPTFSSSRAATPKPNNWRGCALEISRTVGVAGDDSLIERTAAVAARRHPEPAAQGHGTRSRSMRRSTRRSPIGSRRGGRRSNSTAVADQLALRFGADRGRHRGGRTAGEEANRPGRREAFSMPPRRAARWRSA